MKPLLACVAALALALALNLGFGFGAPATAAPADPGTVTVAAHVLPAAPQKTKKLKPPRKTATPIPTVATPTSTRRSAAEAEGERWVQIAVIAGVGLLGAVLIFLSIGALLRRRPRVRR